MQLKMILAEPGADSTRFLAGFLKSDLLREQVVLTTAQAKSQIFSWAPPSLNQGDFWTEDQYLKHLNDLYRIVKEKPLDSKTQMVFIREVLRQHPDRIHAYHSEQNPGAAAEKMELFLRDCQSAGISMQELAQCIPGIDRRSEKEKLEDILFVWQRLSEQLDEIHAVSQADFRNRVLEGLKGKLPVLDWLGVDILEDYDTASLAVLRTLLPLAREAVLVLPYDEKIPSLVRLKQDVLSALRLETPHEEEILPASSYGDILEACRSVSTREHPGQLPHVRLIEAGQDRDEISRTVGAIRNLIENGTDPSEILVTAPDIGSLETELRQKLFGEKMELNEKMKDCPAFLTVSDSWLEKDIASLQAESDESCSLNRQLEKMEQQLAEKPGYSEEKGWKREEWTALKEFAVGEEACTFREAQQKLLEILEKEHAVRIPTQYYEGQTIAHSNLYAFLVSALKAAGNPLDSQNLKILLQYGLLPDPESRTSGEQKEIRPLDARPLIRFTRKYGEFTSSDSANLRLLHRFEEEEQSDGLEKTVRLAEESLKELRADASDVSRRILHIRNFLKRSGVSQLASRQWQRMNVLDAQQRADEWDALLQLLDVMEDWHGQKSGSLDDFLDLMDFLARRMPVYSDASSSRFVMIAPFASARVAHASYVFLLHADSTHLPNLSNSNQFSDRTLETISRSTGKSLRTSRDWNELAVLNLQRTMAAAQQQLTILWSGTDEDGRRRQLSYVMEPVAAALEPEEQKEEKLRQEERFQQQLLEWQPRLKNGESIQPLLEEYESQPVYYNRILRFRQRVGRNYDEVKIREDHLPELLRGETLDLPVTALESFAACPFKFYMDRVIRGREQEEFALDPRDTGNFYHAVFEEILAEARPEDLASQEKWKERLERIVEEKMDGDWKFLHMDPGFSYDIQKLKKTALFTGESIRQMMCSETGNHYEPAEQEWKTLPGEGMEYRDPTGKLVRLYGTSDRIDVMKANGTEYVRVIDYKLSEQHKLDQNQIAQGNALQPPLYARMYCDRAKNRKPAAMYYQITKRTEAGPDGTVKYEPILKGTLSKEAYSLETGEDPKNWKKPDPKLLIEQAVKTAQRITAHILSREFRVPGDTGEDGNRTRNCKYCPFDILCHTDVDRSRFAAVQEREIA